MSKIRIALLGFGNVGRALARYIVERPDLSGRLDIAAVADSAGAVVLNDLSQVRSLLDLKSQGRTVLAAGIGRPADFINALSGLDIRVVVESLPTNIRDGEPALGLIGQVLRKG